MKKTKQSRLNANAPPPSRQNRKKKVVRLPAAPVPCLTLLLRRHNGLGRWAVRSLIAELRTYKNGPTQFRTYSSA